MASKMNIRQVDILKDAKAMADIQTTINDDALFIMQVSGGSDPIQAIKASDMQTYFSHIDVDSASDDNEYTLVFIDPDAQDSGHEGFVFHRDSQGYGALSYNPSSNLLKTSGSITFMNDSQSLIFQTSAVDNVVLEHAPATSALRLTGSGRFEFRDTGASVHSSEANQLDLDAGSQVEVTAPTFHIVASSTLDADVGSVDIDSTGEVNISGSSLTLSGSSTATIDYAGAVSIDSDSSLTLGGSAVDVDADGGALSLDGSGGINIGTAADVAVDFDAAAFDLDASGELSLSTTAGALLESSEAASDAIRISATDPAGGIDLAASGSVVLSLTGSSADFSSGIQVNIDDTTDASSTSTGALVVDGGVGVAQQLHVGSHVVIGGNLTVDGTTTTVNSTTMTVDDTIIVLGQGNDVGGGSVKDLGLLLERSGSGNNNVAFFWDESVDYFRLKQGLSFDGSSSVIGETSGSYAKLQLGEIDVDGAADIQGAANLQSTLTVAGQADFNGDVNLGNAATDTVTFVADVDSNIVPDSDGNRALGASGAEWSKLFVNDVESEESTLDLIAGTQVNISGNLDLSGSVANFSNLASDYANDTVDATADFIMVRDESAGTAKHMGWGELGQYLSRGGLASTSGSNGVKVDESTGVLSIQAQESLLQSGNLTAGMTGTISHSYDDQIVQATFAVYLNGQLQQKSGSISGDAGDYRISGTTLTMNSDIDANDVLIVRYLVR